MKSLFFNNEKVNFEGFETLTSGEMLKVRGGSKPIARPIDIFIPTKK